MTVTRDYDLIVVGAGVMGAATAREAASRGRKVLLIERFQVGHTKGSSHGRSRIFRLSYRDEMYVRMAQEAGQLWRAAEHDSGERLLETHGGIDLGEGIDANARALKACGATYEELDGREAMERWPLALDPLDPVLYQPDAGIVYADLAVRTFVALAARAGCDVVEGKAVERIVATDDNRTELAAGAFRLRAPRVVITAGAWARGLLAPVGIDLPVRVTRESVAYFRVMGPLPPPLVEWGSPACYVLPSPGQGLKAAQHVAGPTADPDEDGAPDAVALQKVASWLAERVPTCDGLWHRSETCLYTNTSDERFILERHGSLVVGSPCSGHGFKFAPLIGRRLASLALED